MNYKSVINTFQKIICGFVILLITIAIFMNPLRSGIASLFIGILLLYVLFNEKYSIDHNLLTIKKGFETKRINIYDIELLNLVTIRNTLYIEIIRNQRKVAVKPIEAEAFIQHLIKINPDINIQNINRLKPLNTVINNPVQ